MDTSTIKCTPEECQHVAKRAYAAHALLVDEHELQTQARRFQALGNPIRLKILGLLSVRELCTCDIVTAVGVPQATVVHHLHMLQAARLITSRHVGKFTLYALAEHVVAWHRAFEALPPALHAVPTSGTRTEDHV